MTLQNRSVLGLSFLLRAAVVGLFALALFGAVPVMQAQTFTVLHTLNGGSDGSGTINGLAIDRLGNLYGTAYTGGIPNCPSMPSGCGTVFKLSRQRGGWAFSVLYSFTGTSDGWWPQTVAVGRDGSLYGTTSFGGNTEGCIANWGCGTIFRLQPPVLPCRSVSCPWMKTTLFKFGRGPDGIYPSGTLTFDQAGNIYGTTNESAENGVGNVWELSPSNGRWIFNVIYAFQLAPGGSPLSGMAFDSAGNLWGSGNGGVQNCQDLNFPVDCGAIYELTPSQSGWNMSFVFNLDRATGGAPLGAFIFDSTGNMYGTLADNGPNGNGGVFQLSPSTHQLKVLYSAMGNGEAAYGPQGGVVMGANGNLFAADPYNRENPTGYVFELTPSNGNWIFTDLHDFTGGSGGVAPYGPLVVDAQGNVYGANGANVVFEITP